MKLLSSEFKSNHDGRCGQQALGEQNRQVLRQDHAYHRHMPMIYFNIFRLRMHLLFTVKAAASPLSVHVTACRTACG
jgi:hypothetical protein